MTLLGSPANSFEFNDKIRFRFSIEGRPSRNQSLFCAVMVRTSSGVPVICLMSEPEMSWPVAPQINVDVSYPTVRYMVAPMLSHDWLGRGPNHEIDSVPDALSFQSRPGRLNSYGFDLTWRVGIVHCESAWSAESVGLLDISESAAPKQQLSNVTELVSHISEQAHPLSATTRVAFMHGRPAAHPVHALYAQAVGAKFYLVDPIMRWHDRKVPRWYRYLSWIVCSIMLATRRQYSVWLSEGSHIPPVLIKHMPFPFARPKIIVHLGDETLYFLANQKYSPFVTRWIIRILNQYDAIICEGRMQTDIAMQTLGLKPPPIHTVINGVPRDRCDAYRRCQPDMRSTNVIIVANGRSGWRLQYKGLDLAVSAVVACRRRGLTFG